MYDLETKKISVSHHVVFHETKFPFQDVLPQPQEEGPVLPLPLPNFPSSQPYLGTPSTSTVPSNPTPENSSPTPSSPAPSRPVRERRPPAYLQDFHCSSVHGSSPHSISSSKTGMTYPLHHLLSTDKLSSSPRSFLVALDSTVEPKFFSEAVKIPHWQDAMTAEITALEQNRL